MTQNFKNKVILKISFLTNKQTHIYTDNRMVITGAQEGGRARRKKGFKYKLTKGA